MNQLKNITEDYCKILTALEKAVAACDKQTEGYKDRLMAYETIASDRAERLLGAKIRSAHYRQRKTGNDFVRSFEPISPELSFQDMSPSEQQDAYEKLLNQVSVLTSMLRGSTESEPLHQYVVDGQKNESRQVDMTSPILSDITEVEAPEALVSELEAGQHYPKHTENADNNHTKVAVKISNNHGSHRGLRRILKTWPSTTTDKVVSCVHKFSFDSTLRSIDGNIWGFQKCCVCMRIFHSPICDLIQLQSYDEAFAVEKHTNPIPTPMGRGFKVFGKLQRYMKK